MSSNAHIFVKFDILQFERFKKENVSFLTRV